MKNSNKLAMFNKLKNTMQEVEWHSTFNFERYEIDEETKAFIEKKEELISNSFKRYSNSKYDICMALMDVKVKLRDKDTSFMAWYTHIGFTKDKVSELLKTYELYVQAPQFKDYISSLSGVAVRLLTHKDVSPQLAMDIMEKGVKNMEDIRELIELALAPVEQPKKVIEYKGAISKKSLKVIRGLEKQIKKSTSPSELNTAKKEIEAMKKLLSEMEKTIANKEKEYENQNNLKLSLTDDVVEVEEVTVVEAKQPKIFIDSKGYIYFIRSGISGNSFKAYFAKNKEDYKSGFRVHGVASPNLPYRTSKEEAYEDLVAYAKKKKMKPLEEGEL